MKKSVSQVEYLGRTVWGCHLCGIVRYSEEAAKNHRCPMLFQAWR